MLAVLASTAGVAHADGDGDADNPDTTATTTAAKPAIKDGYCQWIQGAADAQADFFVAPNAIASIGYVKEPNAVGNDAVISGARGIAVLSWNLIGIMQSNATKAHADADCQRHQALDRVQGETVYKALKAKIKVYDGALAAADKILEKTIGDVRDHRTTAQEMVATRLRVNELHDLQSDTRQLIEALPRPAKDEQIGGALASYYKYDAAMEEQEGKLRRLQGVQVTVSGGFDEYFDRTDNVPFTALLQVTVNLGVFFQGDANDRAAAGRRTMVREQHQVQLVDTTVAHIQDELKTEKQRADETGALEQDLANQISTIEKIGGDDNLRYRDTVWFDYIKVKAEHAYFAAHVASLQEVLGEVGGGNE
nr:hypothetical protein [Kofleriaceae bacterium]